MHRSSYLLALLFFISFTIFAGEPPRKTIMAYYMPWFTAKPFSKQWGWHWTMDHFDPDRVNPLGQREIASWYYPLIGPYDSSDPAVLEYHVLLMKLAGVDGVIVDWYGSTTHLDYGINNEATTKLFNVTRKAGLKFAVCYEDQTLQHLIEAGHLSPSNALAQAQADLLYLQSNFFGDPSYFRLQDKPVLLNFGPQYFLSNADWVRVFGAVPARNRPAFFNEDNRLESGMGAFSWPPMWLSQAPGTAGVLSFASLKTYLGEFDRKASGWPAYISSAFPRFHDIYQRAGVRNYWGYLGDRNGQTFRDTLTHAMTNSAAFVQLVTWNDFGEGTVLEPTREYGFRDLGIVQDVRRQYIESGFSLRTNDLALALSYYEARRAAATNQALGSDLEGVFLDLVRGNLSTARARLHNIP